MKIELPKRYLVENHYYFDTSSINKLTNKLSRESFIKTQNLWAKKNRIICISAVNLYEIFQNKDNKRKEDLLHRLGILCYGKSAYFDIPTRILFGEILGYTTNELTPFEESLKNSWFDVKNDPDNITINLDFNNFNNKRNIYKIFKRSVRFILKNDLLKQNKDVLFDLMQKDPDLIGAYIIKLISSRFDSEKFNIEIQLKSFLIFLIFCFGIEPQNSFLEEYWKNKENFDKENELQRTLNRMMSLLREYDEKTLFDNIFIQLMVDYILYEHNQTTKKICESTLSDTLHLIYCFYVMHFITDDSTILTFSDEKDILRKRVYSTEKDFFFT